MTANNDAPPAQADAKSITIDEMIAFLQDTSVDKAARIVGAIQWLRSHKEQCEEDTAFPKWVDNHTSKPAAVPTTGKANNLTELIELGILGEHAYIDPGDVPASPAPSIATDTTRDGAMLVKPSADLETRLNTDPTRTIDRSELSAAVDLMASGKVEPREGVDFVKMPAKLSKAVKLTAKQREVLCKLETSVIVCWGAKDNLLFPVKIARMALYLYRKSDNTGKVNNIVFSSLLEKKLIERKRSGQTNRGIDIAQYELTDQGREALAQKGGKS